MLELDRKSQKILGDMRTSPKRAKKGAMKGLWYAGKELQREAQSKIKDRSGKTGKYYKYKGRNIRASAPGEYPANRSGGLRKSLGFEVLGSEDMEFGSRSTIKYGKYLERGTRKMRRRPFLENTVNNNKLDVLNIVGREIYKELIKK